MRAAFSCSEVVSSVVHASVVLVSCCAARTLAATEYIDPPTPTPSQAELRTLAGSLELEAGTDLQQFLRAIQEQAWCNERRVLGSKCRGAYVRQH